MVALWRTVGLGEIGEFRNGLNFSKDAKGAGLGLINVKDIFGQGIALNLDMLDRVSLAGRRGLEQFFVRRGDIFFVRSSVKRDGIGLVALAKEASNEVVHCGFVIRFRLTSADCDPTYLAYLLRSPESRKRIIALSGGSAITNISQQALASLQITLPGLGVQRRIASILSAYDDLIENNTQRIAILEEMARALYREWFVDFRFPGHEGVRMVESEVGLIPEGWGFGRLDEALVLQRGFDLPVQKRITGDIPVIAATGFVGSHDEARVKGPGVLTGRSGSLGTVTHVPTDFWPLNTTLWVKEFRRATPIWAFHFLQTIDLNAFNSGAAVPTLNRNDLHSHLTVLPPRELVEAFERFSTPLFQRKYLLERENANLRRTRDLLLPRLVSGEVGVSRREAKANSS